LINSIPLKILSTLLVYIHEDLEIAEVMVDVDYTTTVDGNENKTRNLFIIKIENVNEKKMVTEFSYQTLV
ncbi:hypothetical protein, partial [Carnobacterium maltaromaticum]|uniref:hypothetical protein n=1 Tax=Carnobacterium maltaromaticum TaxID=2751 RepID=UPI000A8BACBD